MLSQINEGIRHLLQDGYVVDDKYVYIALPVLLWGGAQVGGDGTIRVLHLCQLQTARG